MYSPVRSGSGSSRAERAENSVTRTDSSASAGTNAASSIKTASRMPVSVSSARRAASSRASPRRTCAMAERSQRRGPSTAPRRRTQTRRRASRRTTPATRWVNPRRRAAERGASRSGRSASSVYSIRSSCSTGKTCKGPIRERLSPKNAAEVRPASWTGRRKGSCRA